MPLGSARLQNPAQPLPEAGSWHTTCAHNHQCLPGFGDHPVAESLRGGGLVAQGQCLPSGGLLGRVPQGFPGPPTRWPTGVNTEDRRLTTAGQPLLTPTQQAVPGGVWGPATQGRTWCIARITRPGSRVQSHPPGWPAPPPPRRLPAVRTLLSRPDEAGSPSPSQAFSAGPPLSRDGGRAQGWRDRFSTKSHHRGHQSTVGCWLPTQGPPALSWARATVLHPFSFSTPALGRPQGGSTTVGSVVGAERSRNHGGACIRLPPLPGRARQAGLQPQLPGVSGRSLGPHTAPREYSPATLIGPRARGCHLRAGGEQPAAARGMAGGNPARVGGPWAGGMEQRGSGAGQPRLRWLQAPMPGALLLLWG